LNLFIDGYKKPVGIRNTFPSLITMPATVKHLESIQAKYPQKFASMDVIFSHIHPGDRIFISTACGEPQFLVKSLIGYVESHPKAFFDAEVLQVWTLGVAPYTEERFKSNFRLNAFFIGNNARDAVNTGAADYSPIFLHQVPSQFYRRLVPVNVALIQTSLPDKHGYFSLGVSVDIVKAAAEMADVVVAQVNSQMPRVLGNSFLHVDQIHYLVHHDEPLLEYEPTAPDEVKRKIGAYVSRIVEDGDTIQVGYGSIPNAILTSLHGKKHLGVHTEFFSDGLADLMRMGVIDNSKKTLNRFKSVASFCMGHRETYEFLHDNPAVEFLPVDETNDPLNIARHNHFTAINAGIQVDLTGQSTAESIGTRFFSGIGGQADFMRGAVLSPTGKSILTLPSTAGSGRISRIVPFLDQGAGVTLTRGDLHYVVTEYGIAYLHGKNIRERAMALIGIAHPKFRSWLIQEAKKLNYIYKDQAFVPGKRGEYPEHLEISRRSRSGFGMSLRPVRISDESLLKDFFYSLSDKSIYRRFISFRKDMPHERLQEFCVIDYTREMVILATIETDEQEVVVGIGQYGIDENMHTAEVAFVVRDDFHYKGIGWELLSYITLLARKQGILGFTAEVLVENEPMLHLFEKMGFDITRKRSEGVYELTMSFRGPSL
jgi:acyl-CoA hydrolase/RimJ/RimL family protein N-acetyltransferase